MAISSYWTNGSKIFLGGFIAPRISPTFSRSLPCIRGNFPTFPRQPIVEQKKLQHRKHIQELKGPLSTTYIFKRSYTFSSTESSSGAIQNPRDLTSKQKRFEHRDHPKDHGPYMSVSIPAALQELTGKIEQVRTEFNTKNEQVNTKIELVNTKIENSVKELRTEMQQNSKDLRAEMQQNSKDLQKSNRNNVLLLGAIIGIIAAAIQIKEYLAQQKI